MFHKGEIVVCKREQALFTPLDEVFRLKCILSSCDLKPKWANIFLFCLLFDIGKNYFRQFFSAWNIKMSLKIQMILGITQKQVESFFQKSLCPAFVSIYSHFLQRICMQLVAEQASVGGAPLQGRARARIMTQFKGLWSDAGVSDTDLIPRGLDATPAATV